MTSVDRIIFRSDLVKVGRFECEPDHPNFGRTAPLDNDVFAFARNPVWIRRGVGNFHYVESGGVVMHRSGTELQRKAKTGLGDDSIWFGLHPGLFGETLTRHCMLRNEMDGAMLASPMMRYELISLVHDIESGAADDLVVEEWVLTHFEDTCARYANRFRTRQPVRPGTNARRRRVVDQARDFLDAYLGEPMSMSDVARAAGASVFHLCRIFREEMGLSLHTYRTWQRLGIAAERLVEHRSECLTDLALELGFSSHSHLSRQFRKHLGVAPSVLRRH